MASKEINKTVVAIDDTSLSYVTVQKNAGGYDIVGYGNANLPEGVVVRGEILKADFLATALGKIRKSISSPLVDVLIPHEYFVCSNIPLMPPLKKQSIKDRVQQYFHNQDNPAPWQQTHVCEFSSVTKAGDKDHVLLRCLQKDIYRSYDYVARQAGLTMNAISSEILAYDHLIPNDRVFFVALHQHYCLVVEFKNGIYTSMKKFQVSYEQFKRDIKKNISTSDAEADKILKKYGVLRAHKDERVYRRLQQSLTPLLDYLSKRKISDQYTILVTFDDVPVAGFVDAISQASGAECYELDIIATSQFNFADILSLHRNESYQFSALIAQALKMWKK